MGQPLYVTTLRKIDFQRLTFSLAHYLYQETQQAYNGFKITKEALVQQFGDEDKNHSYPTLNREYRARIWPHIENLFGQQTGTSVAGLLPVAF